MELKAKEFQTNQTVPSHPLFSSIITLYILILLYFPALFLKIISSPVLISTGILLLSLLRLGAIQKTQNELNSTPPPQQKTHDSNDENHIWDSCDTNSVIHSGIGYDPNPFYADSFVEYWDVRAPLEIIYEAYEGEEDDDDDDDGNADDSNNECALRIERYPSLSLYYPESDTDSSSDCDFAVIGDWDSPERMGFRWEDEDREGLIEIALDGKRRSQFFSVEEDNLIEIDISQATNDVFSEES